MILVIDNYDSFTYNLVQYIGDLGHEVCVRRNDEIGVEEALALGPDRVVISPGPSTPDRAGISIDLIRRITGVIPILGVCLGHQAIGAAFGAKIVGARRIMHGKSSPIFHDGHDLFHEVPVPFSAIRYHSLVIDRASLPDCLLITAVTDMDEIMGVRHRDHPIFGIQFHPESIMTEHGKKMLINFLG
jgi:anthranilate synthase/aminodeoxychorismate synthase-like glutamine amidotransferase